MLFISVLLPEPLGPSSATISSSVDVIDTFHSTWASS